MTPLWEQSKRSWHSEIRVWARGAVGAGNLYAEEMGIWGELKLENLYRNPDGNPIFGMKCCWTRYWRNPT